MYLAPKKPYEDEIARLEDLRYDSLLSQDWSTFEGLCHSDFVYTHTSGEVDTVESYCAKLRAGHYAFHSFDHPIERVWASDTTALVWSRVRSEMVAGGVTKHLDNLVLTVWTRDSDAWELLAQHPLPRAAE